jgi:thymidine kinase
MSEGQLEVITGPMYSGKTSELIRRINRAEVAEQKVKCFKPVLDDRYSESEIGSHDGNSVQALMVENSRQIVSHVKENDDVVVIDEANFFDGRLTSNLQSLAYRGHRVIAAGTDQTFRGTPFTPVGSLMAVADQVDKLQAVCQRCGDDASMNQRLDQSGEPASVEEPTVKVGGDDIYEARCRDCHEVETDE